MAVHITRHRGEEIVIDTPGGPIHIEVGRIGDVQVRLMITAPIGYRITRPEWEAKHPERAADQRGEV